MGPRFANPSKPHLSACLRVLSRRRTQPLRARLFPDVVTARRSFGLRVSGAVAPSAPATEPVSPVLALRNMTQHRDGTTALQHLSTAAHRLTGVGGQLSPASLCRLPA